MPDAMLPPNPNQNAPIPHMSFVNKYKKFIPYIFLLLIISILVGYFVGKKHGVGYGIGAGVGTAIVIPAIVFIVMLVMFSQSGGFHD